MSNAKGSAKASVLVGCRFPAGLVLRLYEMVDQQEVMPGGRTHTVKLSQPTGREVRLNGYADPEKIIAVDPKGKYGVTEVPADFWEQWLKDNQNGDLVKNQVVFAKSNKEDLKALGKEIASEKNGFEPIDPNKPQERLGKSRLKIEPAKEEA